MGSRHNESPIFGYPSKPSKWKMCSQGWIDLILKWWVSKVLSGIFFSFESELASPYGNETPILPTNWECFEIYRVGENMCLLYFRPLFGMMVSNWCSWFFCVLKLPSSCVRRYVYTFKTNLFVCLCVCVSLATPVWVGNATWEACNVQCFYFTMCFLNWTYMFFL